ncbi:MAG: hypothetical protein JXQ65_13510 [Candidatus Marinimicrobia bacterium]|nr:hypothetical protein [Candidatus Neomarinimicrobiota bacterium]
MSEKSFNPEVPKNTMKTQRNFILILMLTFLFSCELPHQPGPMPKEILDLNFEPGLNILGIVRLNGYQAESFIYIEEVLKTKDYYAEENEFYITGASVKIQNSKDSLFTFEIYDEIDSMRYTNPTFIPEERETYYLNVEAETENGELHVTAKTTMPAIPSLDKNTIILRDDRILLDLITTEDAFRYDIVLFFAEEDIRRTLYSSGPGVQTIEMKYSKAFGKPVLLGIAAYDRNLTDYLNASSSIIPQTYQEDISTVEGGYGCFGAISIQTFDLGEL